MKVYILCYDWGSYDDYTRERYGTFSSVEAATAYYKEHIEPNPQKRYGYTIDGYWIEVDMLDDPLADTGEETVELK